MKVVYGFACAQTQINNGYAVWPAVMKDDVLELCDISGFLGTRLGKPSDSFFPSETGDSLCKVAMKKAYAKLKELDNKQ